MYRIQSYKVNLWHSFIRNARAVYQLVNTVCLPQRANDRIPQIHIIIHKNNDNLHGVNRVDWHTKNNYVERSWKGRDCYFSNFKETFLLARKRSWKICVTVQMAEGLKSRGQQGYQSPPRVAASPTRANWVWAAEECHGCRPLMSGLGRRSFQLLKQMQWWMDAVAARFRFLLFYFIFIFFTRPTRRFQPR